MADNSCMKRREFCDVLRGKAQGFTLAELLISLAILGVIATFTIPKILNSQQDGSKKAIFRETLAALMQAHHYGMQSGKLTVNNHRDFFFEHINAVKYCDTDATAQDCWHSASGAGHSNNEPGLIMHNGAEVTGINPTGDNHGSGRYGNLWEVDWNGEESPNTVGQDIVQVVYCYGDADCDGAAPWMPADLDSGRVGPCPDSHCGTGNEALYEWIFSQ